MVANKMLRPRGSCVLVTGATGFLGTALAQDLVTQGFRVIGASRRAWPETWEGVSFRRLPSPATSSDHEFDILLDQVDHVVHLAGIAHTEVKGDAADAYRQANTILSERLARAAANRVSGKFILMSSIRAQCGSVANHVVREIDPPHPTDLYGQSKLAAEQAVAAILRPQHYTILRPVAVYGPGVKGNFKHLLTLARLPVPLPLASLTERRSFLAYSSLCRAITHCLTNHQTDGNIYNVADKSPVTVGEAIVALRHGFRQRGLLFQCPPSILKRCALLLGQSKRWETLSGRLMVSSGSLEKTGWRPATETLTELRKMARAL
ncbi:NAD-dependent epimerase/dehydratase family protein [Pseudorhizobium flavum]|uniref:NAD-dependent epimerase/dehydratase family protein n=1 Tax=Pseudorhizobium flavum TaxID=1335061 RepID=UPI003CD0C52B